MSGLASKFFFFLAKFRDIKNNYVDGFEKAMVILSVLLMIFGLAIVISGMGFIDADIWSSG